MDVNDIQKYFQGFKNERLTASEDNLKLAESFVAPYGAKGLQDFIRNYAWKSDEAGSTRVYLVKDREEKVALYYSLRCGLVYDNDLYEKIGEDKREFVDEIVKSYKNGDATGQAKLYDACASVYGQEEADKLYEMALHRAERKEISKDLPDSDNSLNVERSYSAIELQHFCKNALYPKKDYHGIPIGFGLFWEIIVPQVKMAADFVGCEYLYLFAADKAIEKNEPKNLVAHYRSAMKFSPLEELRTVKPEYDRACISLIQPMADLDANREQAWAEHSDSIH